MNWVKQIFGLETEIEESEKKNNLETNSSQFLFSPGENGSHESVNGTPANGRKWERAGIKRGLK